MNLTFDLHMTQLHTCEYVNVQIYISSTSSVLSRIFNKKIKKIHGHCCMHVMGLYVGVNMWRHMC